VQFQGGLVFPSRPVGHDALSLLQKAADAFLQLRAHLLRTA
jgi:hypothetical protein